MGQNQTITTISTAVQLGWDAPSSNWSQVSLGQYHSYAVNSGGTLWGWGNNSWGQLGLNNQVNQNIPIQVGVIANTWSSVSIMGSGNGQSHSMAIRPDGTLWGWGHNQYGSLGLNTTGVIHKSPTQVGTSLWKRVSIGYTQGTIAIQTNGTLWAWGYNINGQLGLSDTVNRSSPVQVGTALWKNVYCGYNGALAIQSNGTLWAWGYNAFGQLGVSDLTNRSTPVQIGADTWLEISRWNHSLGIKTNGTLWAWGKNNYGQVGNNTTTNILSPVQIGANSWKKVAAGGDFSMAIRSDDTLWVWGGNGAGQLGTSNTTYYLSPTQVGADTWKQVSCGYNYTLAIKSNNTLWSWGHAGNPAGQLGTTTTTNVYSPLQVGVLTNWSAVKAGYLSGAALNSNGYLYTWGANGAGELGFYDNINRSTPTLVGGGYVTNVSLINTGSNHALAIKTDGTLWSWGLNSWGQVGTGDQANRFVQTQIGTSNGWTDASGGFVHSAAINNGYLYAWGNNAYGQLGQNNQINYSTPTILSGIPVDQWKEIPSTMQSGNSQQYQSIGAIKSDGTLWTWGNNGSGGLGLSDTTNRLSPCQVGTSSYWTKIACGYYFMFAIQSNGTLWSWGANGRDAAGQLGLGDYVSRSTPTQVGTDTWSKVFASKNAGFGIKTDGTLWSWGYNGYGEKGNGGSTVPVQVASPGISTWNTMVCNQWNSLGIKTDGTLWSWGRGADGSLGVNTTGINAGSPIQIGALSTWSKVAGTWQGGMAAIKTDGTLWTWGYNLTGELGLGDKTNKLSPVQVGTLSDWTDISGAFTTFIALKSNGTLWNWGGTYSSPVQIGNLSNWAKIVASSTSYFAVNSSGNLYAWGSNASGELAQNNTSAQYTSPTIVGYGTFGNNWSQVTCGYYNTIATRSDGTLWSWGLNSFGALAQGDQTHRSIPTQVGTLSNWSVIPTNVWQSMFATTTNGTLYAWGNNTYGQLGRLGATVYSHIQIGSKSNWIKVHAGTTHWLGIDSNNTLWAQGNNSFGQLGTSDLVHRSSPTQIGNLSNWSQVACGDTFSTALKTDGTLWAWGANSFGQLGQADYTHRSSPVQVGTINTYYKLFTLSNTILAEIL